MFSTRSRTTPIWPKWPRPGQALAKAEASVPSAQANLARYERLVNSGATQIEYENAKVTLLQAEADVAQTKAALETAEINLDLTKVRAPFDGITSATAFSIGNVVTANQTTALTTLRQIDPIYIDLMESSINLLRLRTAISSGQLGGNAPRKPAFSLTLEDGDRVQAGRQDRHVGHGGQRDDRHLLHPRTLRKSGAICCFRARYVRATLTIGEGNGFPAYRSARRAANANGDLTAKFVSSGKQGGEREPSQVQPAVRQRLAGDGKHQGWRPADRRRLPVDCRRHDGRARGSDHRQIAVSSILPQQAPPAAAPSK